MMSDAHFDAMLEEYQELEAELAYERERLGDQQARRPGAVPKAVTFGDLRVGDFMTADDPAHPQARWVEVVDLGGVGESRFGDSTTMSITFRTPQPIGVGMCDRWILQRQPGDPVVIDGAARTEVPS